MTMRFWQATIRVADSPNEADKAKLGRHAGGGQPGQAVSLGKADSLARTIARTATVAIEATAEPNLRTR